MIRYSKVAVISTAPAPAPRRRWNPLDDYPFPA